MEEIKETTDNVIDFSSKNFEQTQQLITEAAKLNTLVKDGNKLREQKEQVMTSSIKDADPDDIIQMHLDKFETPEALNTFLEGNLTNPTVIERINSFFTNDETGEVLTLVDNANVKSEIDELDFKRGMLLYFKQNDYYLAQIDKEVEEINKITAELNSNVAEALDPLKDNVLAYAEYLEQESQVEDGDSDAVKSIKAAKLKKALAIKSGYTLDNMINLIEKHPGIINNSLTDFRNDSSVKDIGKRYAKKLKSKKIGFNLFGLLADDIHDSLEYRCLPLGEYPEGMENFTVFFIIRSMSMGLTTQEDIIFHASVQVCLTKLMEGSLDPEIAERVKSAIINFLNKFVE